MVCKITFKLRGWGAALFCVTVFGSRQNSRLSFFLFFSFFKLHRCELFAKELCGTWPHWTRAAAAQHSPPCLHIYGCCLLQFVTQMGDQRSPANHLWLRPTFLGRFSVNDLRHIIMVRTGLGVFIYLISKLNCFPAWKCLFMGQQIFNKFVKVIAWQCQCRTLE